MGDDEVNDEDDEEDEDEDGDEWDVCKVMKNDITYFILDCIKMPLGLIIVESQ